MAKRGIDRLGPYVQTAVVASDAIGAAAEKRKHSTRERRRTERGQAWGMFYCTESNSS